MRINVPFFLFWAFGVVATTCSLNTIKLTKAQLNQLGTKIWYNECKNSHERLTWWGKGEPCASMGIGHFLWYPKNVEQKFTQTFPELLSYFKKNGITLPHWLTCDCPWQTREQFLANISSVRMKELRTLLSKTIELQTQFIVNVFIRGLKTIIKNLSPQKQKQIERQITMLLMLPQGIFALIDYANFKGFGVNPHEQYQQQGWGLLHVLLDMQPKVTAQQALAEFIRSAKNRMQLRVSLAQKSLNEDRFLCGWIKRIESYANS